MKSYNVLSLFSGCGGLDLGFKKQGFNIIKAVDNDPTVIETYRKNIGDHIECLDIKEFNGLLYKNIDVIIGGPPCQGFSLASNLVRNFKDDPRNYLYKEYIRIIEEIKPKIFLMENVKNFLNFNSGKFKDDIIEHFKNIGYNIEYKIIKTVEYGIPQKRERVFFVGTLFNNNFIFIEKSVVKKTIYDVIFDLETKPYDSLWNHVPMNHSEQMLLKMSYVKEGKGRECIPEELKPKTGDVRKYIRLDRNKPSFCITTDNRKIFHYLFNRALTIRELARIQTFPDNFIFYGNRSSQEKQIGNAVPPQLSEKFAKKIKEYLNE